MNLSWSNRVIKYILFVFNLIFVITGIIMVAVGVSVKSYYTDYDLFLNDSYFSLPNLLIAIGSLIFFISFFGCCGAIKENWFLIFIFSILLSIIFIMEFSAGIAGYVLRDKTSSYLSDELQESMAKYEFNAKHPGGVTEMWDKIQETFECCGTNGPEDWPKVPRPATTVPDTTTVKSTTPPPTEKPDVTTPPTKPKNDTTTPPTKPDTETTTTTLPPNPQAPKAAALTASDPKDLPGSCCRSNPGATGTIVCRLNDTSSATYFNIGCVEGFGDYLKDHAVTIGGVGLAIGFIQLVGVIFACHLTKQLKNGFHST